MVNELQLHGSILLSPDKTYLMHVDGTPFFWLADTWWYGATDRAAWPEPFQTVVKDRVRKGFSVVQLVVGVPPEVPLDSHQANSQGHYPFTPTGGPNPDYFTAVKQKVQYLAEQGIVPCIVGGWGPQMKTVGYDKIAQFWQEIIKTLGSFPVIWCIAGEVDLLTNPLNTFSHQLSWLQKIFRLLPTNIRKKLLHFPTFSRQGSVAVRTHQQRTQWSQIGELIRTTDSQHHLITAHPHVQRSVSELFHQPDWLDIDTIQSGHSRDSTQFLVAKALEFSQGSRPFLNMEPWYEGILGDFGAWEQRYAFWMSVLAGAKGHSYGADGVWNMRTHDQPFLSHWGSTDWQTALQLPGGTQLGMARRWLLRYPWWQLRAQQDWISPAWSPDALNLPLAAAFSPDLALVYIPVAGEKQRLTWTPTGNWLISVVQPSTCQEIGKGKVDLSTQELIWNSAATAQVEDLVLLLERQ